MIRLSGRFRSALIIGVQGIRARKMRTFLSMISLFLGVLAVVAVQGAAETAKTLRLADLELHAGKDGTRQLFVPPSAGAIAAARGALKGRSDAVGISSMQAIIGEPGVTPINPGADTFDHDHGFTGGGFSGYGPQSGNRLVCDQTGCHPGGDAQPPPHGQAIEVVLTALTGDIRQFMPFRPVAGSFLDFGGDPRLAPQLVLNKEAAKGFARYRVPAEMRIDGAIADSTPHIIGVVDDGNQQPTAYVRADELDNWLPNPATSNGFGGGLQVWLAPTAHETERLLMGKLKAAGVPAEQLQINTVDARKQIAQELALIRWIFLGMAGLVLLIGVAGILNVGLATVGERVEEFALRRAVGTPRVLLAGIVLAETLLTGLLTAAAAIGVAALGLRLAGSVAGGRIPDLHNIGFPYQAGVAGVVAGLIAGLLGGFIPAIRAARIPIATVMRA